MQLLDLKFISYDWTVNRVTPIIETVSEIHLVPFHIFVQKLALSYSDFEISKFNGMRTIIA